jgi:ubiquinone/menaquinone biosynthesis C-methylase UbiE
MRDEAVRPNPLPPPGDPAWTSRFIRRCDAHVEDFVYPMPRHWWSRPYEYAWAAAFAGPDDVALDAACGVSHPLKFHLARVCRETHACDLDPAIESRDELRRQATQDVGVPAGFFMDAWLDRIQFRRADLLNLPYPDTQFTRVFCISVLEHLPDPQNRPRWSDRLWARRVGCRCGMTDALRELRRVLAPGGLLVMTFDHPQINLPYLGRAVEDCGFTFAGPVEWARPADAIHSWRHRARCFRAVCRAV